MNKFKRLAALIIAAAMILTAVPVFAVHGGSLKALSPAEKQEKLESLTEFSGRLTEMKRVYGRRAGAGEGEFATARIIVKSASDITDRSAVASVSGYNDWHILQYNTPEEAMRACESFAKRSEVEYAEPDMLISAEEAPAAAPFKSWGFEASHVNAGEYLDWLLAEAGSANNLPQVIVGVVDTGADQSHPFLSGRLVPGYDVANNDNDPSDGHSHGTHVSGTIVDGTLSNVKVMPIKVLADSGYGDTSWVALGIQYGYLHGCSVENLSLGGVCDGDFGHGHYMMGEAIEEAFDNGTVVCVAAGNESEDASLCCPANVKRACVVAAIDQSHSLCYFSNYGSFVDLAAPGSNIYSSVPGGGYGYKSGTSMACPHVAAVAAMLLSARPGLSADAVVNVMKNTTVDIGLSNAGTGMLHVAASPFGFDDVINAEGCGLHFYNTGSYPWQAQGDCLVSGNAGVNGSTSAFVCGVDAAPDQRVSFEYKVSSQQGCDILRLKADNTVIFEASGEQNEWQTANVTIPGSGWKLLRWEYVKDGSVSEGSDAAWVRGVRVCGSLMSYLNLNGSEYSFVSGGAYPWMGDDNELAAVSGNAGVNNSESVMEASVELVSGMIVCFNYKVSAGAGDVFTVRDNGAVILSSSSTDGYELFEYTVPGSGPHTFTFTYAKNGSGSAGSDRAWVKDFSCYHTFESAVNGSDRHLPFDNNGEYPWISDGERVCSSNYYQPDSESSFTLTLPMQQGETLSFRYRTCSESNYDFFRFYVNGTQQVQQSGDRSWLTYTFTAAQSGTYNFKWSYEKDYMSDYEDDCAYVDDVVYSGALIFADGDANADGVVDSLDALLVLRYTMGLVGANALDLAHADVNGDGAVDSADALLILRRTLGM